MRHLLQELASAAFACRDHLPDAHLTHPLLPLLVRRNSRPYLCLPVPSPYWPRELLARWRAG